jgi:hypothetical protein
MSCFCPAFSARVFTIIHLITTGKNYAFTVLHTSQITVGQIISCLSDTVLANRCLVVVCKGGPCTSFCVPDLSRASATSCYHQSRFFTQPADCLDNSHIILLVASEYGPNRKHHSSLVVQFSREHAESRYDLLRISPRPIFQLLLSLAQFYIK